MHFISDSSLFAAAAGLADSNIKLDSIGTRVPKLLIGGVGVSGDCFIDQVEKRLWLSEMFDALTTDMESSAVAQVCTVNGLPFIVFRSASDLAGGSGSESARQEIDQFFRVAAENSCKIVIRYLELL
jgi:adenosylhomocysteine nucleosidase